MPNWKHVDDRESEIDSLRQELGAVESELAITREEVVAQTRAKEEALAEIERLKSGKFTEQEFDNLCHNFDTESVCQFRRGCYSYQIELFGEEKVRLDIARELRWALYRVSFAYGMDGLAEGMAAALVGCDHLKPSCEKP